MAVADLSPANLEAAPRAPAAGALLRPGGGAARARGLDFCDICTPPFTHRPLVEAAAARGVHVLCEKPIAADPRRRRGDRGERARRRDRASCPATSTTTRRSGRPWCGCCRGSAAIHLVEYEVLRTEANPGNPNWSPAWRTDPALAGGGILFDHGAHILYQLRSVLGEPAAVQATVRNLCHSGYGVEDSAFVVLDFGDRLAEVRLTWAARRRVDPLPVRG